MRAYLAAFGTLGQTHAHIRRASIIYTGDSREKAPDWPRRVCVHSVCAVQYLLSKYGVWRAYRVKECGLAHNTLTSRAISTKPHTASSARCVVSTYVKRRIIILGVDKQFVAVTAEGEGVGRRKWYGQIAHSAAQAWRVVAVGRESGGGERAANSVVCGGEISGNLCVMGNVCGPSGVKWVKQRFVCVFVVKDTHVAIDHIPALSITRTRRAISTKPSATCSAQLAMTKYMIRVGKNRH